MKRRIERAEFYWPAQQQVILLDWHGHPMAISHSVRDAKSESQLVLSVERRGQRPGSEKSALYSARWASDMLE